MAGGPVERSISRRLRLAAERRGWLVQVGSTCPPAENAGTDYEMPPVGGDAVRTTMPNPFELSGSFPFCTPRPAVRLHPRRPPPGSVDDLRSSKVGGIPAWPVDEGWPRCPKHGTGLVALLQLNRADVPEAFVGHAEELLQVMWCPRPHDDGWPKMQLVWRDVDSEEPLGGVIPAPPSEADPNWVPEWCVVHPERVVDLPALWELPPDIDKENLRDFLRVAFEELGVRGERLQADLRDDAFEYSTWGSAPGWKVGGWPDWIQDPDWPSCERCKQTMDHLLTVASFEFESWRWAPTEERPLLKVADWRLSELLRCPADLLLGDAGNFYVFVCHSCPDQWASRADCS